MTNPLSVLVLCFLLETSRCFFLGTHKFPFKKKLSLFSVELEDDDCLSHEVTSTVTQTKSIGPTCILDNQTYEEIEKLEKRAFRKKLGISSPFASSTEVLPEENKEAGDPIPYYRECEKYCWSQDKYWINMTVPLPHKAVRDDVLLVVGPDSVDLKVKSSPELDTISGDLCGITDASTTKYEIIESSGINGELDTKLIISFQKKAAAGTHELWYGLFLKEYPCQTVRYGKEEFPKNNHNGYIWNQNINFFTVSLNIPPLTRKQDINLNFARNSKDWLCQVNIEQSLINNGISISDRKSSKITIGGRFWGSIIPEESIWFIETKGNDEIGYKKKLVIEIAKQHLKLSEKFERNWWPSLLEEQEEDEDNDDDDDDDADDDDEDDDDGGGDGGGR